ncbi:MAG: regulatory protein GemA [[Actinobacillus] rossii]|uniref:Mu-like prophage protein gp16 n=1 Tax=[Actinobacillus] rossii TaxID=123820 RepID=A0A380U1M7_9PAST|nr:regulatory protein GemA [[Actinobacillus] rossii]MDY4506239.1 regulatory protein GemA [[Actinobacillus] rossii]SUT91463.1 Mu-like prophage protein gp16 [[Actinobacillus] rossii]SUT94222.1 Mu-like prophage protein gp16 [[Actinobacillus] rossii]
MLAQTRSQMITKIHIGKNQLKMTDNQYRVFLLDAVDKHSCAVMSDAELMQVLQAMRKQGVVFTSTKFKEKRPTPRADKAKYLAKITALLTNQGKPQKYADAMAKKAFGIEFVNWLEPWQLKKIIQMLAVYERRHV